MAALPNGTTVAIASVLAASKTTTVATNASECVVTSASHGYSNGDYVLMTSGWSRINLRAFRIKSITTDTFTLEGMDTSNTTVFPTGSGLGTVRKVSTWQTITSILSLTSSGGDPRNVSYRTLDSDIDYSLNDGFNATVDTITIDADAIGTAGYTALVSLTSVQPDTVIRKILKSGSIILTPGKVALNENPSFQSGQVISVTATLNGTGITTRYAS